MTSLKYTSMVNDIIPLSVIPTGTVSTELYHSNTLNDMSCDRACTVAVLPHPAGPVKSKIGRRAF